MRCSQHWLRWFATFLVGSSDFGVVFVFCSFVVCYPFRKDSKSLIGGSIEIEVDCYDETLTGLDEISILIDGCSLKLGGVADEAQYVQYSRWRWVCFGGWGWHPGGFRWKNALFGLMEKSEVGIDEGSSCSRDDSGGRRWLRWMAGELTSVDFAWRWMRWKMATRGWFGEDRGDVACTCLLRVLPLHVLRSWNLMLFGPILGSVFFC